MWKLYTEISASVSQPYLFIYLFFFEAESLIELELTDLVLNTWVFLCNQTRPLGFLSFKHTGTSQALCPEFDLWF